MLVKIVTKRLSTFARIKTGAVQKCANPVDLERKCKTRTTCKIGFDTAENEPSVFANINCPLAN